MSNIGQKSHDLQSYRAVIKVPVKYIVRVQQYNGVKIEILLKYKNGSITNMQEMDPVKVCYYGIINIDTKMFKGYFKVEAGCCEDIFNYSPSYVLYVKYESTK